MGRDAGGLLEHLDDVVAAEIQELRQFCQACPLVQMRLEVLQGAPQLRS
jgi:hypothetical protein